MGLSAGGARPLPLILLAGRSNEMEDELRMRAPTARERLMDMKERGQSLRTQRETERKAVGRWVGGRVVLLSFFFFIVVSLLRSPTAAVQEADLKKRQALVERDPVG